jgi:hypothetical protein
MQTRLQEIFGDNGMNGETSWRLAVDDYGERSLPLKVDAQQEPGLAPAGRP